MTSIAIPVDADTKDQYTNPKQPLSAGSVLLCTDQAEVWLQESAALSPPATWVFCQSLFCTVHQFTDTSATFNFLLPPL